jgi:hypothetical protein
MFSHMTIHENPLIAAVVSTGSVVFGIYLLRWVVPGLLKGELRYRFKRYDRISQPIHFWCAAVWGVGTGIFFSLGGLAMLYLAMMKRL